MEVVDMANRSITQAHGRWDRHPYQCKRDAIKEMS